MINFTAILNFMMGVRVMRVLILVLTITVKHCSASKPGESGSEMSCMTNNFVLSHLRHFRSFLNKERVSTKDLVSTVSREIAK